MPWAGVVDLIVLKMFALPLRGDKEKKVTKVKSIIGPSPLRL